MANLSVRYMKTFMAWVAETGRGVDLLAGVKARPSPQRDRVLSLLELGRVANALEAMPQTTPVLIIRLLIATAGRRNEAASIRRDEIDIQARLWTLPAARNKSNRVHLVPLNSYAIDTLEIAMARTNREILFAAKNGQTAYSAWTNFKKRLDLASGVEDWVLHDLRRTFATVVADAGIDMHIADRCLNHAASSTASVVSRIYQRSEFLDQRRHALDVWASAIEDAKVMAAG
jgi:integrase